MIVWLLLAVEFACLERFPKFDTQSTHITMGDCSVTREFIVGLQ